MLKTRLFLSAIFALFLMSTEAFAASELQQMRTALGDMQKLLQQQQVRIEQLEKQASERLPTPVPACHSVSRCRIGCSNTDCRTQRHASSQFVTG